MARHSEYDYNLCEEICDKIADGMHIMDVLNSDKKRYPSWPTFRRWKQNHDELQTLYTRSIQDKTEMITFEIVSIMNDVKNGVIGPAEGRLLIDTLKWFAAKFYPKMYGDKIDHTTDGEKLPTSTTSSIILNVIPPKEED